METTSIFQGFTNHLHWGKT